jgi:pimeloyl-ACP methyl ester carboxylesterase
VYYVAIAGSLRDQMENKQWLRWLKWGLVGLASLTALAFVVAAWIFSNVIEDEVLTPRMWEPEIDLQVLSTGQGRIVLNRTDVSEQDGVWGLVGPNGYGQVIQVIEIGAEDVERGFRLLEGSFDVGDEVYFDQYAYLSDPLTAHAMAFEEARVPGDLGVLPAWLIEGDRDTWVIIVHGKGLDERKQALRMLPVLVDAGYPVLVVSYRNDVVAHPSETGRYGWGYPEWRDLEVALEFADLRGADDFVLYGYSMGGALISAFLHESAAFVDGVTLTDRVRGVIMDSPVLDLEAVIDAGAEDRGIPPPLTAAAKWIAAMRFDLDWDALDQVERAGEFDPGLPILLFHGVEDTTVPVAISDAFAAALSSVQYERVERADHVYPWNVDPAAYEDAVMRFLAGLDAVESTE